MSFFRDLIYSLYGRLRGVVRRFYDPAVKPVRLKSSYRPTEGLGVITDMYGEVERLDAEIEQQRQLSRSPEVSSIDRLVARARMRDLNAQRANRISIAREVEKRILPSLEDEHDELLAAEESPRLDYIENYYRHQINSGRMTLEQVEVTLTEHHRGVNGAEWEHITEHLREEYEPYEETT